MKLDKNMYMIITNNEGNVIYPTDEEKINFFNSLIKKGIDDNSLIYLDETDEWFEYENNTIIIENNSYNATVLKNVTSYMSKIKENEFKISELTKDETTKINTKKTAYQLLKQYLDQCMENVEEFAVVICDLDSFKKVNDTYGHVFGDLVLKKVAEIFYQNTRHDNSRASDIVGRIGGDEFLIVLKNISKKDAINKIETIRKTIENTKIMHSGKDINIGTMSFGIHYIDERTLNKMKKNKNDNKLNDELLYCSDVAMYLSKKSGKNQVTLYSA